MDKPKGGRGHKAPYQTTHLRVPEPIKDELQTRIDQWREDYLSGESSGNPSQVTMDDYMEAIGILEESLTLKANAGGKIKERIREAIALLKGEDSPVTTTTTHTHLFLKMADRGNDQGID